VLTYAEEKRRREEEYAEASADVCRRMLTDADVCRGEEEERRRGERGKEASADVC
jgi:hypothetical protein